MFPLAYTHYKKNTQNEAKCLRQNILQVSVKVSCQMYQNLEMKMRSEECHIILHTYWSNYSEIKKNRILFSQ